MVCQLDLICATKFVFPFVLLKCTTFRAFNAQDLTYTFVSRSPIRLNSARTQDQQRACTTTRKYGQVSPKEYLPVFFRRAALLAMQQGPRRSQQAEKKGKNRLSLRARSGSKTTSVHLIEQNESNRRRQRASRCDTGIWQNLVALMVSWESVWVGDLRFQSTRSTRAMSTELDRSKRVISAQSEPKLLSQNSKLLSAGSNQTQLAASFFLALVFVGAIASAVVGVGDR